MTKGSTGRSPANSDRQGGSGDQRAGEKKRRSRKRILNMLLVALVSLLLLWVVFSSVDFPGFVAAVRQIRWPYLFLSLAVLYGSLLLAAFKYAALYYSAPKRLVIRASMASSCTYIVPAGGFLGMAVTTAMLADVDDVYMAASSAMYDSLLRFSCLVFMGMVGVVLSSISLAWWVWALFLLLTALLVFAIIFTLQPAGRRALRAFGKKVERFKWGVHISRACDDLAHFGKGLDKHPIQLVKHYVYGMASELCTALPFLILGPAFGIDLGLNDWLWINAILRLVSGLPISMGGLGAREGAMMLLMGWMGVASGPALTVSLLYSVLNLLANSLGALFFIGYPKSPRTLFKDAWDGAKDAW